MRKEKKKVRKQRNRKREREREGGKRVRKCNKIRQRLEERFFKKGNEKKS